MLIKCKECGASVSNKAPACVQCGAPIKRASKPAEIVGGLVAIILVGMIISEVSGGSSKPAPAPTSAEKKPEACATDDIQCLGDKGIIAAGVYCKDPIERLAAHSVKWVDGTFETKFDRFRWADKANGIITYIGDKAEFQNGFGAYTRMIYQCDMDKDGKTVLNVRAVEGRLPG